MATNAIPTVPTLGLRGKPWVRGAVNTVMSEVVFVVDDDQDLCRLVGRWLDRAGHKVCDFESGEACLQGLSAHFASTICLDLTMPGMGGLETLERIKALHPRMPVIVLTADDSVESVVAAMKLGAYDYLVKPLDKTKLLTTVGNALEKCRLAMRVAQLEREAVGHDYLGIVGASEPMRALFHNMDRVAASDITALIQGETGVGKELVARAIHSESGRRNGPFVAVNFAAIPETLVESEFFGHEKGSFTGATQRRRGKFEEANRGTLFLDEIAEISLPVQAKLLRVLQERKFERLGGSGLIASDFRLLAASNSDLAEEVRAGRFREDLYFRISVFDLDVPTLRDRGEDVLLLARRFIREFNPNCQELKLCLSDEAAELLCNYNWPGNVRELQNVIQRALVVRDGQEIRTADLPNRLRVAAGSSLASPERRTRVGTQQPEMASLPPARDLNSGPASLAEVERMTLEAALRRSRGNISQVMRELKVSRTRLYRMLKKFKLMSQVEELRKEPTDSSQKSAAGDGSLGDPA